MLAGFFPLRGCPQAQSFWRVPSELSADATTMMFATNVRDNGPEPEYLGRTEILTLRFVADVPLGIQNREP
jgi:hypothetical protein